MTVVVLYVIIGLFFAAVQDYDKNDPEAYNLLKGLFVASFWPIIAIVFLVEGMK